MAITGSYFLDTIDFSSATAVFTDINLTTKALDGHYSFNGSVRQQVSGLLNAIMVCPTGMTLTNYFTLNYDTSCLSACTAPVLVPVVNCVVSDWSACVNGTQTRSVTTQASGGGTECPALSQPCTVPPVPCPNCVPGTEIQIGSQIWTKCNLDVTTYSDGVTPIPQVTSDADWANKAAAGIGAWCYYDFNPANGPIYGKLYNWYALAGLDGSGTLRTFAPTGYRIPSDEDWTTLNDYLNAQSPTGNVGAKMKETGFCHWQSSNLPSTNSSSFTGLPGGEKVFGSFFGLGCHGFWWSSSVDDETGEVWYRYLRCDFNTLITSAQDKGVGYSVRLIKN